MQIIYAVWFCLYLLKKKQENLSVVLWDTIALSFGVEEGSSGCEGTWGNSRVLGMLDFLIKGVVTKVSVQFSHSVVSDSLQSHGLQHARLPCPSPTPGACSNSCPLSQWCHPTISSSVIPFSSCLQSFPESKTFSISQFFTSGVQSIGASASASLLPMNIQDWFPLRLTGWISMQSKGYSRVFSNTTDQKHQFFGPQLSLQPNSHIHTWLLENCSFD